MNSVYSFINDLWTLQYNFPFKHKHSFDSNIHSQHLQNFLIWAFMLILDGSLKWWPTFDRSTKYLNYTGATGDSLVNNYCK